MMTMEEIVRFVIVERVAQCNGDKKLAAASLGVSTKTIYNHLNKYKQSRRANHAETHACDGGTGPAIPNQPGASTDVATPNQSTSIPEGGA